MNDFFARFPTLCFSIVIALLAAYGFYFPHDPSVYAAFLSVLMFASICFQLASRAPFARVKVRPRFEFDREHFRRANDPLLI